MAAAPHRQTQLQSLLRRFDLPVTAPVDWLLLDLALTHASQSPDKNYQQLEFTGDAVVRLAAAEVLMAAYPDAPVGKLSALRAMMVSDRHLASLGELYGLDRFLWVSPAVLGDKKGRVSLMADAFEAVLGALYLSVGNLSLIRPWLDEHLRAKAEEISQDPAWQNYKEALQAWTQAHHKSLPEYRVVETTPDPRCEQRFEAQIWLGDRHLGTGYGASKKSAEQAAAQQAYEKYIKDQLV